MSVVVPSVPVRTAVNGTLVARPVEPHWYTMVLMVPTSTVGWGREGPWRPPCRRQAAERPGGSRETPQSGGVRCENPIG